MQIWPFPYFTILLVSLCSCSLFRSSQQAQSFLAQNRQQAGDRLISFGDWEVIGPFRIGTREAVWGADPLRAFQGQERKTYPSPLTVNATVRWEAREVGSSFDGQSGAINIHLSYPSVDWEFLRSIYGWAALQYQAWAKSVITFHGHEPTSILLFPTNVLDFLWNNQTIFGGDFFGFERAPVVLKLVPGQNEVRVRLIHDVRANGGSIPPTIDATLRFSLMLREGAVILPESLILPDIINGKPASSPASVAICNFGTKTIVVSQVVDNNGQEFDLLNLQAYIVPGQSRPIGFSLGDVEGPSIPRVLKVRYLEVESNTGYELTVAVEFSYRNMFSPHKITFLHLGGSVSYAILRPPPRNLPWDTVYDLPIMLNLHGAGVDVDSPQARHSFDAAEHLPCWMLFPAGGSPWSGDDWHAWGMTEIYAAIEAAHLWTIQHRWRSPGILDDLLLTGHSNGGQGAWQFAMHQPDHIIAAVMVSGYTSIQTYVPYLMWTEADPQQNAVLEIALSSFQHELFVENLQRTPILVQHGSIDDNVPVYHSRLMTTLAEQSQTNFTYVEMPTKGHWFDGVMTTAPLIDFYTKYCRPDAMVPPVPSRFSLVVPMSDDMSSKYGIVIDQMKSPDRLGRVRVEAEERANGTILWRVKTSNILRFHFEFSPKHSPDAIQLDDWANIVELNGGFLVSTSFRSLGNGQWVAEPDFQPSLDQRAGLQRGAMDAILRTRGPFQIMYSAGLAHAFEMAVQASRNLLQYFGADAVIQSSHERELALSATGNVISIVLSIQTPLNELQSFPVYADEAGVWIRHPFGTSFLVCREAKGAAWLQPLPNERLELVIWGIDEEGLQQAARMVPTLTGVGQPDFVVFGKDASWRGHAGTLAMGFFDYSWNISAGSYIP